MNAKNIGIGAGALVLIAIVGFVVMDRQSGTPEEDAMMEKEAIEKQTPLGDGIDGAGDTIISELLEESEEPLPEEDFSFIEEDNAAYEEEAFGEF